MVYESMSLLELRKAAKEKNLKGISGLKKQELIEYLKNNDNEHKQNEADLDKKTEQPREAKQERVPRDIKAWTAAEKPMVFWKYSRTDMDLSAVRTISLGRMTSMYLRRRFADLI